jgi:HEAT repeat protein
MSAGRLLLALLLLACVSPGRADDPDDTARHEATLKQAGLGTDGPALLHFFRKRTPTAEDQKRLAEAMRHLGDGEFEVREKASQQLITAGRAALPLIRPALDDPDAEVVRRARECLETIERVPETSLSLAAAALLAVRKPDGATAALLDYFPVVDDFFVQDEFLTSLATLAVRDGRPDPLLVGVLKSRESARRAAAGLILGRLVPEQRAAVRALLTDAEPRVRFRAAEGLLRGGDREAVPALVALLADGPPDLASSAEDLLFRIAGEKAPAVALGGASEDERSRSRDAWAAWWRAHAAEVDLGKIELDQRALGLTLIVATNGYGGNGRVWEVGRDRKTIWELRDVGGPFDAVVLPGRRVLIAEYSAHRITERDLSGKVLWEHKVEHVPLLCHRLSGGVTLIATNYAIMEVTREGNRTVLYNDPGGHIFSAQRLRNGNLLYGTYTGELVELDRSGRTVRRLSFPRPEQGLETVEVLPGGRLLIPMTRQGKVVEMDMEGKIVWELPVSNPTAAVRLPNGHTLVGSHRDNCVIEFDRDRKVVWTEKAEGQVFRVRYR